MRIVRSVSPASLAEQFSEGPEPQPGGIAGSVTKRGVKRKLDAKSLETKYEVLMEVEKGQRTRKQIAEQYGLVCFVCFVALRPKSTAMVMAGRSVT